MLERDEFEDHQQRDSGNKESQPARHASIRLTANAPWELVYNRGRMIRKTRV
jgi:hypothetical protein